MVASGGSSSSGNMAVATNVWAALVVRELPFPHSGFGQDDEWVLANFTNATEILSVGYPQWVDAQVGEGLTNGLYKLTVSVAEDPSETTQISVGDLSIAVTNAGEYVFLLEKGPAYPLSFFPPSTNISVDAVDDVPRSRSAPMLRASHAWGDTEDGVWRPGFGTFECDYVDGSPSAMCWWLPSICGFPDVSHLGPSDPSAEFSAVIFDCAHPDAASFEWTVSEELVAATPRAQSTVVTAVDIPSWRRVTMAVSAFFGSHGTQTSTLDFNVGTNVSPQARVSLSIPDTLFPNDDFDTVPGYVAEDFGRRIVRDDDLAVCFVSVENEEPLTGRLRLYSPAGEFLALAENAGDRVRIIKSFFEVRQ